MRQRAEAAFVAPLKIALADLSDAPAGAAGHARQPAGPTSCATGSPPDGRARVEVDPKGDPNDNESLRQFAAPCSRSSRTPPAARSRSSNPGDTIVRAFIEAGVWALLSIAILLWIVLRRFGDVLLTLDPAAARRRGHARDLRADRHAAQLRQHHRVAAAARRRRGVQDLLHHGVAGRADRPAAVEPDARRVLQRA